MAPRTEKTDVLVVGAGLAGLTTAAFLARGGKSVTVLERASRSGGRAATSASGGVLFNQGAHALYTHGRGVSVLKELGVPYTSGLVKPGGVVVRDGKMHQFPGTVRSVLGTTALGFGAKLELARTLGGLAWLRTAGLHAVTARAWLDANVRSPEVRAFVEAAFRVSSYTHDPDHVSAAMVLSQLQIAARGSVHYLDGGWSTLVDGLTSVATAAGARIVHGAMAEAVLGDARGWGVRTRDGAMYEADQVVLAAPLTTAATLAHDVAPAAVAAWRARRGPVRASCLDVALRELPRPNVTFALGIDRPTYFSDHSAWARLGPAGTHVVHMIRYGGAAGDPRGAEAELEALLELVQPGAHERIVARQFLPDITVASDMAEASAGGMPGRPTCAVPGAPGLWVAGDWVGAEGFLADASFASARAAAQRILAAEAAAAA